MKFGFWISNAFTVCISNIQLSEILSLCALNIQIFRLLFQQQSSQTTLKRTEIDHLILRDQIQG